MSKSFSPSPQGGEQNEELNDSGEIGSTAYHTSTSAKIKLSDVSETTELSVVSDTETRWRRYK